MGIGRGGESREARKGVDIRSLTIAEKSLLHLERLELFVVVLTLGSVDQGVDIVQVAVLGDVDLCVLFPEAIVAVSEAVGGDGGGVAVVTSHVSIVEGDGGSVGEVGRVLLVRLRGHGRG